MSKKDNTNYIIIGIAAILCFLIYRYKTKVNPPSEPPPQAASSTLAKQTAAQPEIIDRSEMTRFKGAEQKKKRMALAVKEKLGMQRWEIPRKNGEYFLPIEVKVKNLWCQGGEYDVVKDLVRNFDKKVFLLSIESSTRSGEIADPLRMTLSDLSKGFRHSFKLKMNPKTSDNITLSLCTDKLKLGKCSEHKPADYPKLQAQQLRNPKEPINDDFTFLFQSLYIKNGDLVSYGSLDFSANYQKSVSAILKKEDFEMGPFEKNWNTGKTIRSEPITLGPKQLILYISRNDPKCDMR